MHVPGGLRQSSAGVCVLSLALASGAFGAAPAATVTRLFRPERQTLGDTGIHRLQDVDEADWIWGEGIGDDDAFVRFRATFSSDGAPFEIDVSADNRFVLYLDGAEIARGPHRGEVERWPYQSYAIGELAAGEHRLEAVVYHGRVRPSGQLSYRGGLLVKASGAYDLQLTTGKGAWRVAELRTMEPIKAKRSCCYGAQYRVRGTSAYHDEPPASAWTNAVVVRGSVWADNNVGFRQPGWALFPSERPEMLHRRAVPGRFVVGGATDPARMPLTVPAQTRRTFLWDLGDYYCAYPLLRVSGGRGAKVRWGWAESLVGVDGRKGDRSAWKGKTFPADLPTGVWDEFLPDGRAGGVFTTPWWRAGRWCEITVETADEPLVMDDLALVETHYPYDLSQSSFSCDDPALASIRRICLRGLEMCSHETYMDCPFYEQYQYPGDSRIEALVSACVTRDDRLMRQAVTSFDLSRRSDGIAALHAPASDDFASPTYTLAWILMCRDFALWHDNDAWLKARLPGLRHALMGLAQYENVEGLLDGLPGWNFIDWVERPEAGFVCGMAPDGRGLSAANNLLYLYALRAAAFVERVFGTDGFAEIWDRRADRTAAACRAAFWCPDRALFADTVRKDLFSEHAQCLALLAEALPPDEARRCFDALVSGAGKLAPASTYFSFYLFEAYAKFGRADLIRSRFDAWRRFVELGAATPFENQNPEFRSDCHAWSAAPVYFMQTVFAGVTPSSPRFGSVSVAPQPAGLKRVSARTPTPRGVVAVDLAFADDGSAEGTVTLPDGLPGTFEWAGRVLRLHPGTNKVSVDGKQGKR